MIIEGDCLAIMPTLTANSVDAIVCDPPYHLTTGKKGGTGVASDNSNSPAGRSRIGTGFMGKAWDGGGIAFDPQTWRGALRVAKPGAHMLAFGGTRTFHRLMCAIEDGGWEIRDTLMWVYGSGFPKSHNGMWGGTALKPAWEPIILARKPLIGTVAANVLQYGTGGLNIDGCRVGNSKRVPGSVSHTDSEFCCGKYGVETGDESGHNPNIGRWPTNLVHDGSDEVVALFPQSAGQQGDVRGTEPSHTGVNTYGAYGRIASPARNDAGSAARFFYCAKASRKDRNAGCEGIPESITDDGRSTPIDNPYLRGKSLRTNSHPTVKPTDLMRYLCRLITPPGGTILDPFCGSGSTGKAATLEYFEFIGIELEAEYAEIARARIKQAESITGRDLV